MIPDALKTLGLTDEEIAIYTSLLSHGAQSATQLAKTSQVQRTYVYRIVQSLATRGLVSINQKKRSTVFSPASPDRLSTLAAERRQRASQAETMLESLLPTLRSKYQAIETRPVVTYYEGIEGIKKIFQDIYGPKSEPVYGCVDIEKADSAVPGYIVKDLIPLRIKNKVKALSFIADSPGARQLVQKDKESLRESVLLDKSEYPIPAEIDVYEDKVALLSFAKGKFVGVLIQNADIAQSLKSIMKLAMKLKR